MRGTVVRTIGGDTLVVRLASGKQLKARLAGVAAPAGPDCYAAQAARRLRAFAGKRVTLAAAGAGRWYAASGATADVGRALVADGFAQVDVWGPAFSRFADYIPTAQLAQSKQNGMWRACTADVAVTIQPVKASVDTGANAAFALEVANTGPLAAPNVVVDLRPPPGEAFVSANVDGGSCTIARRRATCALDELAAAARAKGSVVVTTSKPGIIAARATVKFGWCVDARCGTTPVADSNRVNDLSGGFLAVGDASTPLPVLCHPSYPTVCIPPPPPRLECNDLPVRNFRVDRSVPGADPQKLDNNTDGVGCTFDDY
jgi:uncharacterized repeat protein (TIGR01451 family)